MSSADELALAEAELELAEAEAAAAQQPKAKAAPREQILRQRLDSAIMGTVDIKNAGAGETFLNKTAEALPLGRQAVNALTALGMSAMPFVAPSGAKLTPQARAALESGAGEMSPEERQALLAGPKPGSLLENYRNARESFADRTARGAEAHKTAAGLGTVAGTALSLAAPLPKFTVGSGGLAGRLASNALTAGAYGAVNGAANSRGNLSEGDFGQVASDALGVEGLQRAAAAAGEGKYGRAALETMGAGGVGGALTGGLVVPAAGAVLKGALKGGKALGVGALRALAKPGQGAQDLQRLGVDVEKLTLGQLNPNSTLAQMEEAGQHALGTGKVIEHQKERGLQAWRDAVVRRAAAPGEQLSGKGDTAEQLAEAYGGFRPAYEGIGKTPVATAGPGRQSVGDQLRKAFTAAAGDEGVIADDAKRGALGRYLQNQASAVHFEPGKSNTVQQLQKVRENIREKLSQASMAQDFEQAAMLRKAEESVTQHIADNISPADAAKLRATDAQYSAYKTVEDAVRRAGDNKAGLTPKQLSAAVKARTSPGAYARGGGGDLRELAVAGSEALQPTSAETGVRQILFNLPGVKHAISPLAALANTDSVKRAVLGLPSKAAANSSKALPSAGGARLQMLLSALRGGGGESRTPALATGDFNLDDQTAQALALRREGGR